MHHKPLDKAGITIAVVCALHCLFLPVLLPVLGLLGVTFLGYELIERAILTLSMIVGAIAVTKGFKHHQSPLPAVMLALGGLLYFNKHHVPTFAVEVVIILAGAALIIGAHGLNLYLCRARNKVPCEAVEAVQELAEQADPEQSTTNTAHSPATSQSTSV